MMDVHPACNAFPRIRPRDWDRFVSTFREHGQIQPIVTHDNMILEGRNRYLACLEADPIPRRYALRLDAGGTPAGFAELCNLARRHDTPADRAKQFQVLAKLKKGRQDAAQRGTPKAPSIRKRYRYTDIRYVVRPFCRLLSTIDTARADALLSPAQRRALRADVAKLKALIEKLAAVIHKETA